MICCLYDPAVAAFLAQHRAVDDLGISDRTDTTLGLLATAMLVAVACLGMLS